MLVHTDTTYESILIAGYGGQGILFAGTLLAQAGMEAGKRVSFFPSYGAEIRGGTAHCTVIISDDEIGSPVVRFPRSMIIMNMQSLDHFSSRLHDKGLMVVDTSLVEEDRIPKGVVSCGLPATAIAVKELHNRKVANVILLGALIRKKDLFPPETIEQLLETLFKGKSELVELNKMAFRKGFYGAA